MSGCCAVAVAQTKADGKAPRDSALREHYGAALSDLRSGKLDQASAEFRAFLANAIGQLATDRAQLGDYAKAAPLFDEALALEPELSSLRLEYAKIALLANDSSHAQSLAEEYLKDHRGNAQELAQAHQILGRTLLKMNKDQDARKELETAVALDPSFENGYDLAVTCLDLDDEKCATQLFGEMLTSLGDTPALHMIFGRAYGNSDFAPRAVTEFKKAIAENPRLPGAHYCLAAALLTIGQDDATLQQAEEALKKELEISPHDSLTYAALGKLAATHSKYPEAEHYLKQAIALDGTNPDAFLYLGQMDYDTNRFDDAEIYLRKAIELTSDPSRNRYQIQKAHFLLGRILVQQHKEAEARAEMQIARTLANKVLSHDKSELAGLLENRAATTGAEEGMPDATPAIEADRKRIDPAALRAMNEFEDRLTPAIADSYNNLGANAASSGDYGNALRYFERAARWNPALDGLDYNWGRAAFMASHFSEAVEPLSRYIRTHPNDAGTRAALAMSDFMTENYRGCLDMLNGVDETVSSIPQMQYIQAESLVKIGQVPDGLAQLESLTVKHPEIVEAHRSLGEAFALQGEKVKAVKELQVAIALNPKDAESHYELGKIERESGNFAGAITELQSAIALDPNDSNAHKELANAYKQTQRTADADKELQLVDALQKAQAPASNASTSGEQKNP
ncbi:MAG TPA: tetratricopeptide repeat protein [Terracidiphilus sp.]|nr:tetratricopeptide repeat protein [Terracidiphilus sp.]